MKVPDRVNHRILSNTKNSCGSKTLYMFINNTMKLKFPRDGFQLSCRRAKRAIQMRVPDRVNHRILSNTKNSCGSKTLYIFINNTMKLKFPRDGFEPPLKDPESLVLPLDDLGILTSTFYCKNKIMQRK